ncbi:MCE family protein [Nitriliruptoraceae bacterium ZYF776]|nr:MCE family protein [Profundirhabdus halotolerans]
MRGLGSRIATNLLWIVVFSAIVVVGTFLTYVTGVLFDDSYRVQVAFPEAGGVLPDQQVTVLGDNVGLVEDVAVTREGVLLTLRIDGGEPVPARAVAQVLRRSPIGEQAVDLRPVDPDWTPAEPDARIETTETIVPAPVPFLLEQTIDLFETLEVDDVSTIVRELALALEGRGPTLRRLNRDALDLNRTLVDGLPEFERLIDTSERTLGVLRDQRDTLRSGIANAADLTEILAEQRPNLDDLLDAGGPALDQVEAFVLNTQANLECLMLDLTAVNETLLGPSTYDGTEEPGYTSKLDELERALALNRFFFDQGFNIIAQPDPATGLPWVRVLLVADEVMSAEFYPELRPTPQTRPGAACETDEFGRGVDAVRQPDVQPPHETAPPIDYAPQVEATGERVTPRDPRAEGAEGREREAERDEFADAEEVSPVPAPGSATIDAAPSRDAAPPRPLASTAGLLALLSLPAIGVAAWWLRRDGSRG